MMWGEILVYIHKGKKRKRSSAPTGEGLFVGLSSNFQTGACGKTFYCLLQAISCMQAVFTKKKTKKKNNCVLLYFFFLFFSKQYDLNSQSLPPAVALEKVLLAL